MTENQINEKALETYPEKHVQMPFCMNTNDINEDHREGYKKALNDIESLPKIKGWVVRDKDDYTAMYSSKGKLVRGKTEWNEYGVTSVNGEIKDSSFLCSLPYNLIPDLTFEDEPIEVELLIRKV